MQMMDPETGFMTEARKLFKDEKVVYLKIARAKGMDAKHRNRILKGQGV